MLGERIAAGGMGEVWRGTDRLLGRDIAVKVVLPALMSDSVFLSRFRTEARLMAALRHPGIVQVYDYGEDAVVDGRRLDYLVMEYIEGVPLSERIKSVGRLGVAETLRIVAEAAEALQVAHEADIVHRDVKPSNLLIRPGGSVVLVDFGVARSLDGTGLTATNMVLGSIHYMAPEQAEGKPVTPGTDVYAIGAVAYCCLTGDAPYPGDSAMQVLTRLVQGEAPTLPADVPPAVAALVLRAMDKDPARRYPSAAALAEAASARSRPASARSRTAYTFSELPPAQVPAPRRRGDTGTVESPARGESGARRGPLRRTTVGLLAAGVALGVAGSVGLGILRPRDGDSGQPSAARTRPAGNVATPSGDASRTEKAPAVPDGGAPDSRAPQPSGSGGLVTNPYSAEQVCGPGYSVVQIEKLRSRGALVGQAFLLYNARAGTACATVIKSVDIGRDTTMSVYLGAQGAARKIDTGASKYYAGPVMTSAGDDLCVYWGASMAGGLYGSPPEPCG